MYNPKVIELRMNRMADSIRSSVDPAFTFKEYSTDEIDEWDRRLVPLWDPLTLSLQRSLSVEEEAYIRNEINLCKVNFLYWCTRRAMIKDKRQNLIRLVPTSTQELFLRRTSEAELDSLSGKTGDGILFLVLKARQLGISTISDMIIAHRIFHYANTTALVAADVDERTPNLYEMIVRCFDNLPWYLQPRSTDPKLDYRVKGKQIYFKDQDSMIRFGSSANKQGGSSGEQKGSLGTGMTLPLVHLSELALWQNPYQIDDALAPSIPHNERVFVVFESTAKGRDNWWFDTWNDAVRGLTRYRTMFIPWYTDPDTYKVPAPVDWSPSERATLHAARVKETSHKWVNHTVDLTRDQLYWWEKTFTEYKSKRILFKFLAEYTSDPDEAFQNTTRGVFPTELIDEMRQRSKLPTYVDVKPKTLMARESAAQ